MASFDRIKPGDRLWDCHRETMGNTTMRRMGSWPVDIVEVDQRKRVAVARWNGNAPNVFSERMIKRLRRSPWKATR
jgi:hypothetical protein